MRFTDCYAEASCTAGAPTSSPASCQSAPASSRCHHRHAGTGADHRDGTQIHGLRHRQFGKNHLGDLNEFLPTLHGFDEFFGYLYHLDAMEAHRTATIPRH